MWLLREETKAHAIAIAAFVRERGAVYSAEILERFRISESTLRRRRPVLRRLGLVFVENGRGSFYATAELASQLPTDYLPNAPFGSAAERERA
jgi:DNA-binding IscR family transcriptional regulator